MGHLRTRMVFSCCVCVRVVWVQQRASIDRKHINRDSVPFRQYDWGFESHPKNNHGMGIRNGDFWIPRSDGSAKLKKPKSKTREHPGTFHTQRFKLRIIPRISKNGVPQKIYDSIIDRLSIVSSFSHWHFLWFPKSLGTPNHPVVAWGSTMSSRPLSTWQSAPSLFRNGQHGGIVCTCWFQIQHLGRP